MIFGMGPNIKSIVISDNRQIFGLSEDNKIYRWDFSTAKFLEYWNHPGQVVTEEQKPADHNPGEQKTV